MYENEKVTFASRVIQQVEKYRSRMENARRELAELIQSHKSDAVDVYDEQRIIELDTFLEKALGAQNSVPSGLKQLSNLDRLNKLIDKVDELLERVR